MMQGTETAGFPRMDSFWAVKSASNIFLTGACRSRQYYSSTPFEDGRGEFRVYMKLFQEACPVWNDGE